MNETIINVRRHDITIEKTEDGTEITIESNHPDGDYVGIVLNEEQTKQLREAL